MESWVGSREMRESTEFDDLGSILHAARCTVLRPVYSDTMYALGYAVQVPRFTGTPYKVLDGVIVL